MTTRLAEIDPRQAQVLELISFGGFSMKMQQRF